MGIRHNSWINENQRFVDPTALIVQRSELVQIAYTPIYSRKQKVKSRKKSGKQKVES
jgi:hypothetical protein